MATQTPPDETMLMHNAAVLELQRQLAETAALAEDRATMAAVAERDLLATRAAALAALDEADHIASGLEMVIDHLMAR